MTPAYFMDTLSCFKHGVCRECKSYPRDQYMSNTQTQYQKPIRYNQQAYDPATRDLSLDIDLIDEYDSCNPTYSQPSIYNFQAPQLPFPLNHPGSMPQNYRPDMQPIPPPTRPNYEDMGNRLFFSGSDTDFLKKFMDSNRIEIPRPSIQEP